MLTGPEGAALDAGWRLWGSRGGLFEGRMGRPGPVKPVWGRVGSTEADVNCCCGEVEGPSAALFILDGLPADGLGVFLELKLPPQHHNVPNHKGAA